MKFILTVGPNSYLDLYYVLLFVNCCIHFLINKFLYIISQIHSDKHQNNLLNKQTKTKNKTKTGLIMRDYYL